jgi:hypothetical protein
MTYEGSGKPTSRKIRGLAISVPRPTSSAGGAGNGIGYAAADRKLAVVA